MKKYPVYVKVVHEKIVCVCLQLNKKCPQPCTKDVMYYDEYRQWQECFKNRKDK